MSERLARMRNLAPVGTLALLLAACSFGDDAPKEQEHYQAALEQLRGDATVVSSHELPILQSSDWKADAGDGEPKGFLHYDTVHFLSDGSFIAEERRNNDQVPEFDFNNDGGWFVLSLFRVSPVEGQPGAAEISYISQQVPDVEDYLNPTEREFTEVKDYKQTDGNVVYWGNFSEIFDDGQATPEKDLPVLQSNYDADNKDMYASPEDTSKYPKD